MALSALCGISGAGKTTIQNALLQRDPGLGRLITYTTRHPRAGEVNHGDYHFTDEQSFQAEVEAGHIVCPIFHRGAWYGTHLEDLRACAYQDAFAVLRPDKLGALQEYTPLLGIFIARVGHNPCNSQEDQLIVAHRHLCRYHVVNVPGNLDAAVNQILGILHTGGEQWRYPL